MDAAEQKKKNKCMLYSVMLGMLIFGTANILIQDAQLKTFSDGNAFTHPYMQCSFMFMGELSVFIVYGGKKYMLHRASKSNPTVAPMSPGAVQADQ